VVVTTSWIAQAEAAMRGEQVPEIELLEAHGPPILDAAGRRALIAPLLAAFMWAAAWFREGLAHPLDPIALLLRLLALALSVRALLLGTLLWRRIRALAQRRRYKLALCDQGLLLRTPRADFALQKDDVVDICEQGSWQEHGGARWADVYVVTRPDSGRLFTAIPPLFARTPGVLAEQLMRWRGASPQPATPGSEEPAELASKLFDAVAAGERPAGTAVIGHGGGWLRRGPYATVLLGVALLDGILRMPAPARARLLPTVAPIAALCVLIVPALFVLLGRRELAARKGIALLLTPSELLLRTRAGVQRMRWSELGRLQITARSSWSMVEGPRQTRSLLIEPKDGEPIRCMEASLDAPAEVVAALCDGYRKGLLP
jgi:hypothetical protein